MEKFHLFKFFHSENLRFLAHAIWPLSVLDYINWLNALKRSCTRLIKT